MKGTGNGFSLDRSRGMLGGVCAGLARHFDLPVWVVRLLFVFATFTFPLMFFAYLVLFLAMNNAKETAEAQPGKSGLASRLRGFDWDRPLYKNKQRGKLQGVCAGIAEYLRVNPLFIRLAFLGSLFLGPLSVLLYIVGAIVLEDKSQRVEDATGHASRRTGSAEAEPNFAELSSRYERLEFRLRRLEATITSKRFHLHRELKKMSG